MIPGNKGFIDGDCIGAHASSLQRLAESAVAAVAPSVVITREDRVWDLWGDPRKNVDTLVWRRFLLEEKRVFDILPRYLDDDSTDSESSFATLVVWNMTSNSSCASFSTFVDDVMNMGEAGAVAIATNGEATLKQKYAEFLVFPPAPSVALSLEAEDDDDDQSSVAHIASWSRWRKYDARQWLFAAGSRDSSSSDGGSKDGENRAPFNFVDYVRRKQENCSEKILVYRCSTIGFCGGHGDRINGMLSLFLLAIFTNRCFYIDAPRPIVFGLLMRPRLVDWRMRGSVALPGFHANRNDKPALALGDLDELWGAESATKNVVLHSNQRIPVEQILVKVRRRIEALEKTGADGEDEGKNKNAENESSALPLNGGAAPSFIRLTLI